MVILYFILEPYLLFSFRNKATQADTVTAEAAPVGYPSIPKLENNWRENLQANAVEPLTDAEMDIAGYIMLGYNSEAIAKETRYAFNSVRTYRKNLYSKLQIHKIRELFMVAEKIVKE
jgi:DNA-binding NarL/FixJ family response regulator